MIRKILLPAILHVCFFVEVNAQHCPFAAVYGRPSGHDVSSTVIPTLENDGFYVGGGTKDSLLIIKLNLNGEMQWRRTIRTPGQFYGGFGSMIIDTEGNLVFVTGSLDDDDAGSMIIKYDPINNVVLWTQLVNTINSEWIATITENSAAQQYVVGFSLNENNSPGNFSMLKVDKVTGATSKFSEFDFFSHSDYIQTIQYNNNFIYVNGTFSDNEIFTRRRHGIAKIDYLTGNIVWFKLGHLSGDLNQTANFLADDLLVHNNAIYTVYDGNLLGEERKIFIQKTNLNGGVSWVKEYGIPGTLSIAHSITIADNGLVVFGHNSAEESDFMLFKVDFNGDVIWASSIESPLEGHSPDDFFNHHYHLSSSVSKVNNGIVFTEFTRLNVNDDDIVIGSTDLQGEVHTSCMDSKFIPLVAQDVSNTVFYSVIPDSTETIWVFDSIESLIYDSDIPALLECTFEKIENVNASICDGEAFEGYFQTGIYSDTFPLMEGCDSIRILNLTVIDPIAFSFTHEICAGQVFEGYSATGIFIDTFIAQSGCDSIRTLRLTVNPPVVFTLNKNICHDEIFEGYTITGIYIDTFALSNECDSIRILNLNVFACAPIIYYDLNACRAYMEDGSHMNYSEFTAAYPEGSCADVSAEILQRIPASENKHSCTPGVNNTVAMCVSAYSSCTHAAGNAAAIIIDFNINPDEDSLFRFSGLQFYEKAPTTYTWIDGDSGPNNYPRRYGIRILKNGVEIFRDEDVTTNLNWTLQSYNFIDNELFRAEASTEFRVELLPYCPIGNGAAVSAWDIDEVRIIAACLPIDNTSSILGTVSTKDQKAISNVQILLADNAFFNDERISVTDVQGAYSFEEVKPGACYLKGYKNDDVLNGVNVLDLIHIQRHLLGKTKFTSLHQFVAADVNHNNTVNAIDLVDIQKLLLGKTNEFPRNTSWRFGAIPHDMSGEDISQFRENHLMKIIEPDTYEADFVGIKIGDLNGDVELATTSKPIEERSAKTFSLIIEEHNSVLQIKAGDATTIAAMQFALQIENFEFIQNGKMQVETNNYSITHDGTFRFVWVAKEGLSVSEGEVLFSIILKSSQPASVSIFDILSPELYTKDLQALKLDLFVENNIATAQSVDLFSIKPNPFQSEIIIRLNLAQEGDVKISLFDISGRLLYQINNSYVAGEHAEQIAGSLLGINEGVLYCQIISNGQISTQRIIKLRS